MLYDANYDKDLLEQRTKAKELCYDFNNLRPSDEKGQKEILKENFRQLQIRHANEICRIRRNFHRIPVTLSHLNPPQILPENPR